MTLAEAPIHFALPESSIATGPAEARGTGRDDVRLMVTLRSSGAIEHDRFDGLDRHLRAGDALVVNISATLPAAIEGLTEDGSRLMVHFATPAPGGLWSVELREPTGHGGTRPGPGISPQTIRLPGDVSIHLLATSLRSPRLWIAAIDGTEDLEAYLIEHGRPIQYVDRAAWPIEDYQTIFATHPGSAEMPSAARPFTAELVTRLVSRGVTVVPVVLHAGVSSYEEHEVPGEERFEVPSTSAVVINALRDAGGRVIAVGTTVVRALETVSDHNGVIHPGQGLTDLIITPERGVRAVDGLLTGWHEPRSSHLTMLEAFLPAHRLQTVYDEAVAGGYLWHEFGDELLIVP